MPIQSTDIIYRYSVKTGTAGNTTAGTAAGSLGKYVSTTPIQDATVNNLFEDITGDENAASNIDYKCFFVHNNHATLTLQNTVVWLAAEVAGGANAAIGIDPTAASALGASTPQAVEITDKQDDPSGVVFSSPTSKGAGLAIGNIGPGQVKAVWVRRSATNSAAQNNDGVTIRVEGDTAA